MDKYFTLEEIKHVLASHDKHCVFEIGAPEKILARLSIRPRSEWFKSWGYIRGKHEEFKQCFIQSEIYCPHEGVDRLVECNVNSLDWQMVKA